MNPLKIRPYQLLAKQATWQRYWSGEGCALICMATGLGKTINAAFFTDEWLRLFEGRMLFLVHTIDATMQARHKFHQVIGDTFTSGIATSDGHENLDARMLFTTFETAAGLLASGAIEKNEFGLVVVDEAHHGQATTYRAVIESFEQAFLYGMTATPDRMDGKDIRDLFGEEIFSYPLAQALAEKRWLAEVDYHLYQDNIDIKALREIVRQIENAERTVSREQLNQVLFLESELEEVHRTVRSHQQQDSRTIIFCSCIEHALLVADRFEGAEAYYHEISKKRDEYSALARFRRGELKTIAVVDMFNEAIDVPEANLVVFYRSTNSKRIWLQQLGRGLRKTANKQRVTVLDFVGNCERVLWLRDMAKEIEGFSGNTFSQDLLHVSSALFSLNMTEELVDLLAVLERLDLPLFETWEEASAAARAIGFSNSADYRRRFRLHPQLPGAPNIYYKDVWDQRGAWYGFLGKANPADCYPTWEEASAAARAIGFTSVRDYGRRRKKIDPRLPSSPKQNYADVWETNGFWNGYLGFPIANPYLTWEEASAAAQRIGIENQYQYLERYRLDPRLVSNPHTTYKDVWEKRGGWPGFFGRKKRVFYSTWEEASAAAIALGIEKNAEYAKRYSEDPLLHSNPREKYADEWDVNGRWGGFLGKEPRNLYPTWEEASAATIALGINGIVEYKNRKGEDRRLPSNPNEKYADVWDANGRWGGFLGKEPRNHYPTFEQASAAAIALGATNSTDYKEFQKLDRRLPSDPAKKYADVWEEKGRWYGFFGKEVPVEYYPTWEEASAAAVALDIRNSVEYQQRRHEDPRLPGQPFVCYKDVWIENGTWRGFLDVLPYPTFEEASIAVQKLQINKCTEYTALYKSDRNLPGCPSQVYKDVWKANGGWRGFLGKL
jgi:superfamily II DNA or RNA helicase